MVGIVLALLVELLLILIVLTLGTAIDQQKDKRESITSIAISSPPEPKQAEEREESKAPVVQPDEREPKPKAEPKPREVQPVTPPAQPPPAAIIPVSPRQVPAAPTTEAPRAPGPPAPAKRAPMGPADSGGAAAYADTPRVGSAPNGQPLYAAAWYREPSQGELAGYLSTASGPGWGLIACRTAPDFRVEDCVALDEYPAGSQINRAILAATWQFQVRPPRIGGTPKIGAWVRIRIDYGIRRRTY